MVILTQMAIAKAKLKVKLMATLKLMAIAKETLMGFQMAKH